MVYSKKHIRFYLALAALFFFAPFVQNLLKKNTLDINKEDETFVTGYIRAGYLIIGTVLVLIGTYIAEIFTNRELLFYIYTFGMYGLLGGLVIGVGMVFSQKNILQHKDAIIQWEKTETDASKIIPSFTPIYNVYTRFRLQKFATPFWWIKEARLWRALYILVVLIRQNESLNTIILIAIITRISLLLGNIDIIPKHAKSVINKFFLVNVEEMRCYMSGGIQHLINMFQKTAKQKAQSFEQQVSRCKEEYMKLYSFQNNRKLVCEYGLGIIGLGIYMATQLENNMRGVGNLFSYSALIMLIGKYIVHIRRKEFPIIPVIHEVVEASSQILEVALSKRKAITTKAQKKRTTT